MAQIQAQRRYWAYEPTTLDVDEVMQSTPDEMAHKVAPFLSNVRAEFAEEGGLQIYFQSPENEKYVAHCYAVIPDTDDLDDEEEEEESQADDEDDEDEFDDEDHDYAWMVEIYPEKNEDAELVDYEAIYHWPQDQQPIRFQYVIPALATIAESVYALSDVDQGSPSSPVIPL